MGKGERASGTGMESQSMRHLHVVPNQEAQPKVEPNTKTPEGSSGVTFMEGSTKIDARTGKGNIFKGISQDNTSDSVWDKKRKFATPPANPFDLVELITEPLGQPRSRIAA